MSESGEDVLLHVYDLSVGIASALSPFLLGKQVGGIWHTGVVVYGKEYYFGHGINIEAAGETPFGRPHEVINLGKTHIPEELVQDLLADLSTSFTPESYSLLYHNCNHFSNEFCTFLVGKGIPEHIVGLPEEVLNSPFGQLLQPVLMQMEQHLGNVGSGNFDPAAARPSPAQEPAYQPRSHSPPPMSPPSPPHEGGGGGAAAEPRAEARAEQRRAEEEDRGEASAGSPRGEGAAPAAGTRTGAGAGAGAGQDSPPSFRESFESIVKAEFQKLMEAGAHTAQEAAILALSMAKEYIEKLESQVRA